MNFIIKYIITLFFFFAIDLLWLGVIAKGIYNKYLGYIMRDSVNWAAALTFYFLFIFGILLYAINPALEKGSVMVAVKQGALFGFFTYMTYELTNYAVIKDWPVHIVFIDILWGIILSASVASLSFILIQKLL